MAERPRIDVAKGVDPVALNNLAFELAEAYQRLLEEDGINASGELSRSAINYVFNWKGDILQLVFRLPEQWYYVEQGRKWDTGVTGIAWADPVGDIMRWIEAKHLTPTTPMRSARVPAVKKTLSPQEKKERFAEAIVHKIRLHGFYTDNPPTTYYGKHPLERAVLETRIKERIVGILVDAYGEEIRVELAGALKDLHK